MCLSFLQEKCLNLSSKLKHSVQFYSIRLSFIQTVQFYSIRLSFTQTVQFYSIRFSFTTFGSVLQIFGLVLIHSVQFYNIRFSFTTFGSVLQYSVQIYRFGLVLQIKKITPPYEYSRRFRIFLGQCRWLLAILSVCHQVCSIKVTFGIV